MDSKKSEGKYNNEIDAGPLSGNSHHKGWYSRGYLPHRDEPEVFQSITYRLSDSIPAVMQEKIETELRYVPEARMEVERRIKLQARLDKGYGSCILRIPVAAECIENNWKHFEGERYDLISWVIMPNHVHLLIKLNEGVSLGKVIQSWKAYTSRRLKRMLEEGKIDLNPHYLLDENDGVRPPQILDRSFIGKIFPQGVWMREYWDRIIRNEEHFLASVEYIQMNPVKAGLVKSPELWPWSSASDNRKDRGVNYFDYHA